MEIERIKQIADEVYGIDSSKPFSESALLMLIKFAERIEYECWQEFCEDQIDEDDIL